MLSVYGLVALDGLRVCGVLVVCEETRLVEWSRTIFFEGMGSSQDFGVCGIHFLRADCFKQSLFLLFLMPFADLTL